jgi:pyruvate formate lyase activating enzyme
MGIDELSVNAGLVETLDNGAVRCLACAHHCAIQNGGRGICRVRFNRDGQLRVPYGYVSSLACDPVEKKPFFHLFPGGAALSFGMLGCNLHCSFCQNYGISQELCDNLDATQRIRRINEDTMLSVAQTCSADMLVSTYNEPLITAEWSHALFSAAGEKGLLRAFVSNGLAGPEAVEYMRPVIDAWKVDLKCFDDAKYLSVLGGRLEPVLETIKRIHAAGIWLEIVTLVVPQFNDSRRELTGMAEFIASVSPDIPWHVTAFHPDYKMQDAEATTITMLQRAVRAGKDAGLQFVYAGNIPGSGCEDTTCPGCGELLIKRLGFSTEVRGLAVSGRKGSCAKCGRNIPGIFRS